REISLGGRRLRVARNNRIATEADTDDQSRQCENLTSSDHLDLPGDVVEKDSMQWRSAVRNSALNCFSLENRLARCMETRPWASAASSNAISSEGLSLSRPAILA